MPKRRITFSANFPRARLNATKLFFDGAEDTIVHLPEHIGEGPLPALSHTTRR
ncbi:hypothetical protein BDV06DRAFT_194060 [Aspergillus oleicola]